MSSWNLWHGCHKISEGCQHCYVYRSDAQHGIDSSQVYRTSLFYMPTQTKRNGTYKIPSGELVYTCFTSDFFLPEADVWRPEAWQMMRERSDLRFFFITKRIHRFYECIPADWGEGYPNVGIGCTMENQQRVEERLPFFMQLPIAYRSVICEPLLESISLEPYLTTAVDLVVVGGESGPEARPCHYDWVLSIREQCQHHKVPFHFKQTGAHFVKDAKKYDIPRRLQHSQAKKAGIDWPGTQRARFFSEKEV